jgi:hypothetical protein
MIVTIIHHLLEEFVSDHGCLPKKLHLNLGKPPRKNKKELIRFFYSF